MSGGGNLFSQIANLAQSIISDPSPPTPQKSFDRINNAFGGENSANGGSGSSNTEGGTPTANASQAAKASGAQAAQSQTNQAANANAGTSSLLTGNQGVDPQSLELGRKTLLGG